MGILDQENETIQKLGILDVEPNLLLQYQNFGLWSIRMSTFFNFVDLGKLHLKRNKI